MKNYTLLATAAIMFVFSSRAASDFKIFETPNLISNFNDAEPISFLERGIVFYVFPDGQFDFSTQPSQGDYFFRSGRRGSNINRGPAANNFGGVRIQRDNFGNIRRVGNVFINYDFNNRISRIGSVFMQYNRFALSQVGGLRIIYNRFGQIVDFVGSVNGENCNINRNFNENFNNNGNYNFINNRNGNINGNNNLNGNFNNNSNFDNNGRYGSGNRDNNDGFFYRKSADSISTQNTKPLNDQLMNRNGRR